ncbi:hypothetical protein O3M35_001047 [Rhynocoris fuscipes]|uniref:N-acetyltransferase domain-containing protein n=1 Tax=Rhynocoris fuscipes TaxID=488301 RepID=A0AAW1DST0_9HEMI
MSSRLEFGKFEAIKNGVKLNYKIQTVTPDLIDGVMDLMVTHFLPREPMSSYLRIYEIPENLEKIKAFWRMSMESGASLVALEDTDDGRINIVGANTTMVSEKKDEEQLFQQMVMDDENDFNKILRALYDVSKRANIYDKYSIDKYLSAFGLTVHPNYHGYQIGFRLLECRKPLCESLGLSVTGTSFTAQNSQYLAKKVGFVTLAELDYKTFKINDKLAFPNLEGDIKYMALKYN